MFTKKYKRTFKFFKTAEEAESFCNTENLNSYICKYHKAHYTPWVSQDGKEHLFVAWYVTK